MRLAVALVTLCVLLSAAPAVAQERELMLADGQQVFIDNGCFGCHTVGGSGDVLGPDLTHVGSRYDENALEQWLQDPARHKLAAHVEKLGQLTRTQMQQLAVYLSSLR